MRILTNRWIQFALLFVFLLGAVYYSGSNERWRKEIQYLVFDTLNQFYPREASGQVVIVDIDDESLLEIGQWPWPRTAIADLTTNLTALGAKVIAFDGLLAEPDRSSPHAMLQSLPEDEGFEAIKAEIGSLPDHDEVLAQAIKDSGIFVSGFTYSSYTQYPRKPAILKPILVKRSDSEIFLNHAQRFKVAASFLPELEAAAAGNGSFMAKPEQDGVLRRTGLIFTDGSRLYPSLSLEALRVAYGDRKLAIKIGQNPDTNPNKIDTNYRIVIGKYTIPVESNGLLRVYYRKFDEQGDDYISAHKIINPAHHDEIRDAIQGKLVLIGSSAEGLKDLRSTALEPFQPGVEIHANVIEQILQGEYLIRPNITRVAEASFILGVGLLMITMASFVHVAALALVCISLIVSAFVGTAGLYLERGLLLDPFYPSLCVLAIFMLSTFLTYLRVESEKRQVRDAFGLYISPDFMKELTKNPDKLKLGGEIRDLSVMFTDIRSFTSISEGLTPEELIQLMNDFLTPMSDLVMQNRGTIDKYMGDAMMAFWNAPLDDAEHARNACKTALKMQSALDPINERVAQKAKDIGKDPVLLQAGIGINTGPCAVGNMGSKQRFAYSTLGDAVNLASRLEGQTKNYGVNILIGQNTWQHVQDFACLEMDLIRVKGKTEAVHIYALLGDEERARSEDFVSLAQKHEAMITAYRKGDFKDAKKLAKECKKIEGFDLAKAYDLYLERIETLIKSPPEDWDGVFEATTK